MSMGIINKLISASTIYFFGTEEIDEESEFWYGLFFKASAVSLIILMLVLIF